MKTYSIIYKEYETLKAYINNKDIIKYNNILVQVFCGIGKKEFIEQVIKNLKLLIPQCKIIGGTSAGEILDGKFFKNECIISITVFEKTVIKTILIKEKISDFNKGVETAHELISPDTKVIISFADTSIDGKDFLEDICKKAIEIDLDEICFTEHFGVDPKDVSDGVLDYKAYHECIELCKQKYGNKLNIKRGLEIGEPHLKPYLETLKSEIEKMDLDFIIGSVHNINSIKLRLTMPSKTKSKIYEDYFNEILAMVKIADIDVIGHLDLMKRYAFADYGNYEFEDYKDIIEEILTIAIKRNIGLEINTSGLRNKVNEVYPKIEILNLYKMLGGTIITIGSDSHSTDDCFSYCKQSYDLLKAYGFEKIYTFTKRCPIEHKI